MFAYIMSNWLSLMNTSSKLISLLQIQCIHHNIPLTMDVFFKCVASLWATFPFHRSVLYYFLIICWYICIYIINLHASATELSLGAKKTAFFPGKNFPKQKSAKLCFDVLEGRLVCFHLENSSLYQSQHYQRIHLKRVAKKKSLQKNFVNEHILKYKLRISNVLDV